MRRGEIWAIAGGPEFAGEPRPAVIVQDDHFAGLNSIAVCLLTSNLTETASIRPRVAPSPENGLHSASQVMTDKITAVSKSKFGQRIGKLNDSELLEIDRALALFLGLAA